MPDTIQLYVAKPASVAVIQCSPPSWAAALALAEKRAHYQLVELDFARGEHRAPEILEKNPRATIPILCHGDRVVSETLGILLYIESAFPDPPLLPHDLDARAPALTRLAESAALKDAGMSLFAHLMRTAASSDALTGAFARELEHWARYYDRAEWCAGPALTLGDLLVFTYVATAWQLGMPLPPPLEHFRSRMLSRPSVVSTLPPTWTERRTELAPASAT